MCESAQRLALNVHFKKKRSVAIGWDGVTASGFRPILVPQLLRFLVKEYTPQQVTLIYAGICTNVFVATVPLQPVEWHLKKVPIQEEQNGLLGIVSSSLCYKTDFFLLYVTVVTEESHKLKKKKEFV